MLEMSLPVPFRSPTGSDDEVEEPDDVDPGQPRGHCVVKVDVYGQYGDDDVSGCKDDATEEVGQVEAGLGDGKQADTTAQGPPHLRGTYTFFMLFDWVLHPFPSYYIL